jgi:hypothetical protein
MPKFNIYYSIVGPGGRLDNIPNKPSPIESVDTSLIC